MRWSEPPPLPHVALFAPIAALLGAGCGPAGCDRPARRVDPAPAVAESSAAADAGSGAPPAPAPASASASSSASTLADGPPLTVKTKAGEARLTQGLALMREEGLQVFLANQPLDCDDFVHPSRYAPDDPPIQLDITVPPGPGGGFFVGHRIGVPGRLMGPPGSESGYLFPDRITVSLRAAGGKPGDHVKGRAEVKGTRFEAAGSFDVTVCAGGAPALGEQPADLPAGEVQGTVGGVPFAAKKAIAIVQHVVGGGDDFLSDIELYPADVTCADLPIKDAHSSPSLDVNLMGGVSRGQDFSGTQQPASAYFAPPGWKRGVSRALGVGWIRIERLALEEGARVEGTVRMGFHEGSLAGRFTADVCRFRKK